MSFFLDQVILWSLEIAFSQFTSLLSFTSCVIHYQLFSFDFIFYLLLLIYNILEWLTDYEERRIPISNLFFRRQWHNPHFLLPLFNLIRNSDLWVKLKNYTKWQRMTTQMKCWLKNENLIDQWNSGQHIQELNPHLGFGTKRFVEFINPHPLNLEMLHKG